MQDRPAVLSVVTVTRQDPSTTDLLAGVHTCLAIENDVCVKAEFYRAQIGQPRFCPYCGERIARPERQDGIAWDAREVRELAKRWLGRGANAIQQWISPEGLINHRYGAEHLRTLRYLVSKLTALITKNGEQVALQAREYTRKLTCLWRLSQHLEASERSSQWITPKLDSYMQCAEAGSSR